MIKYFFLAGALMLAPELANAYPPHEIDLQSSMHTFSATAADISDSEDSVDEVNLANLQCGYDSDDERTGHRSKTFKKDTGGFWNTAKATFWSIAAKVVKFFAF